MQHILFLSLIFCGLSSWGISRIGGGKINSQHSLFELTVPPAFVNIEQVGDVIIGNGPLNLQAGLPVRQFLQFREFTDYYSDLSFMGRGDVEKYFISRGWTKRAFASNPCVDVFAFSNATSTGFAATWGGGKGVTVVGSNTGLVIMTLGPLLDTLTVASGACSWK